VKADGIRLDGRDGGHAAHRAALDVEARAVARADDLLAVDFAFGQGPPSWVQMSSIA